MTSTINEIILMRMGIWAEKMVERVEDDEIVGMLSVVQMIYTS